MEPGFWPAGLIRWIGSRVGQLVCERDMYLGGSWCGGEVIGGGEEGGVVVGCARLDLFVCY